MSGRLYILNPEALANSLAVNGIAEKDAFRYLLISTVLLGSRVYVPIESTYLDVGAVPLGWRISEYLALALINLGGLQWCFRTNQAGDGKDFVERFICLTLPVAIRVILMAILVFVAAFALYALFIGEPMPRVIASSINVFAVIVYYLQMRQMFRLAASG